MSEKKDLNVLISDVKVKTMENLGNLKAFVDIVIGGNFVVKGFKVIDGSKGLFVSMPSVKNNKGEYSDVFHAITSEGYAFIQKIVKEKYNQKKGVGNQSEKVNNNDNETESQNDSSNVPF